MREIKFRAKDYTGEWRYGCLLERKYFDFKHGKDASMYYISSIEPDWTTSNIYTNKEYLVIFNTIGQYTGLKDKNNKEIYEGDIVNAHYFFENHDPINLGAFEDESEITGKIVFDLDGFRVIDKDDEERELPLSMIQEPVEELEVLGNIYDNPELLEASNED